VSSLFVPEDEATPLGSVSIPETGHSDRARMRSLPTTCSISTLRDVVDEEIDDVPPPRHRLERADVPGRLARTLGDGAPRTRRRFSGFPVPRVMPIARTTW
jgi:hypothetical protein